MSRIVDRARAVGGAETAIENRQMFRLQGGRAFNGACGVDMADDRFHLIGRVAELDQRLRHSLVHDLDHAAADQLFVFDEGEIRLDAGGVTIHHEANSAGGRDDRNLAIAVATFFACLESFFPYRARALEPAASGCCGD